MVHYFSKGEAALWLLSVLLILVSYFAFPQGDYLRLAASLIGVTSLIFCAKGNPVGQGLIIVFSILYGIISYSVSYYGEMATYLGMTMPMAFVSLISWVKNPFKGNRAEVKVNHLKKKDMVFAILLTIVVTGIFYFILKAFHTANLVPSTISVTTSFLAVYLTYRRSEYFALAYAANDIVLIVLWGLASMDDSSYLSVLVCFVVFLINDIYGFINWSRMKKRQRESEM